MAETFRNDLLYPELSYKIVGALFSVHTELGNRLREVHYQRAISSALKAAGITFMEQVPISIKFQEGKIGQLFVDFLIEDKIVLEVKAIPRLTPQEFRQVNLYLATLKKELGILANFRPRQLIFKRILNASFGNSV